MNDETWGRIKHDKMDHPSLESVTAHRVIHLVDAGVIRVVVILCVASEAVDLIELLVNGLHTRTYSLNCRLYTFITDLLQRL